MTTWITVKNGKVNRILQLAGESSPGPDWRLMPNDWQGSPGDDLSWFDAEGRRIPDAELVKDGTRKDNRGRWFHKEKIGESIFISKLDMESPGEDWTREEPLKDEPFQKWDPQKKKFTVDTERKAQAERERQISEKKAAIRDAEQRIQRSLSARQKGTAGLEDDRYFNEISDEIENLRGELREIME
jgi:hypothetical protein